MTLERKIQLKNEINRLSSLAVDLTKDTLCAMTEYEIDKLIQINVDIVMCVSELTSN